MLLVKSQGHTCFGIICDLWSQLLLDGVAKLAKVYIFPFFNITMVHLVFFGIVSFNKPMIIKNLVNHKYLSLTNT